jgi:hypothetical protein
MELKTDTNALFRVISFLFFGLRSHGFVAFGIGRPCFTYLLPFGPFLDSLTCGFENIL